MREIKFRAWVVDEYQEDENTPKTFKMHHWNNHFFSDASPATLYSDEFPQPEDPCIFLMQYTGLKDKNGKEIYEGDVVKATSQGDHATLEVKWGQGTAGFFLYREYGALNWNLSGGGKNYDEESVEIIGNIHENPELLT